MDRVEVLSKCVKLVHAKLTVDGEFMDKEELAELKKLEAALYLWNIKESHAKYVSDIEAFLQHMADAFPDTDIPGITDAEIDDRWDKFYTKDFTVSFDGMTVTLYNSADTFSDIECMLGRERDEYKEGGE